MMYSEIQAAGPEEFYDNQTQTTIGYLTKDSADDWTKAGTWITYSGVESAKAITQFARKLIPGRNSFSLV